MNKTIKLGFILHGVGRSWGDWRHPDVPSDASTSFAFYRHQAQVAERGKLDLLFVADSVYIDARSGPHYINRLEPLTILSALAGVTERIGLVGTVTTTYSEPYTVARQFASLDHISGGRAGWNVVTTMMAGAAANYGRDAHLPHDTRYRLAAEHLGVVQGLWDSWEADALVHDKASGQFFDPEKLHTLDHVGEFFRVRGPLNISRSPQGQPVIFQAGASAEGRAFAARHADAIFAAASDIDAARSAYGALKAEVAAAGRNPDEVVIMPSAVPIIGASVAEAEAKYREAMDYITIDDAMAMLRWRFDGFDFGDHALDAPFPEIPEDRVGSKLSVVRQVTADARAHGLTLRQVAMKLSAPARDFAGTGEQVADRMQHWVESGAADGFMIYESLPHQLEMLVEHVVPALRARGLFRADYEGPTLRDHLGISAPLNRHAR